MAVISVTAPPAVGAPALIHRLEPVPANARKHPRVDVEQKALQNEPTWTEIGRASCRERVLMPV